MPRKIEVIHADCRDAIKKMADNSVDAGVTDPPYSLQTINKRFAKVGCDDKTWSRSGPHQRTASGFMNQKWDTGETAFDPAFWAEVLRVLKPGAHLVAFGGSRTYHRLACAIEDAGFEIRDMVQWLYGSGFPKSHDVSKRIDKAAGAKRKVVGRRTDRAATPKQDIRGGRLIGGINGAFDGSAITAPATDDARQWEGWGTALKPAQEPIVLARKPLSESTVVANVLKWGTGALNIDACRIDALDGKSVRVGHSTKKSVVHVFGPTRMHAEPDGKGRWPANVIHDGSEEVIAAFPDTHGAGVACGDKWPRGENIIYGKANEGMVGARFGDAGSTARFFYTAKAATDERVGSDHPTVKPVSLMIYLCKLIVPPGGVVLDPFAGTGTVGRACKGLGLDAILIEREAKYVADIKRKLDRPVVVPKRGPAPKYTGLLRHLDRKAK